MMQCVIPPEDNEISEGSEVHWAESAGAKLCRHCNATGSRDGSDAACPMCGGSGYEERSHFIEAAKGFHGFINHPTIFLVGEAGREKVNITPSRKKGKGKKGHHIEPAFGFDLSNFKLPSF